MMANNKDQKVTTKTEPKQIAESFDFIKYVIDEKLQKSKFILWNKKFNFLQYPDKRTKDKEKKEILSDFELERQIDFIFSDKCYNLQALRRIVLIKDEIVKKNSRQNLKLKFYKFLLLQICLIQKEIFRDEKKYIKLKEKYESIPFIDFNNIIEFFHHSSNKIINILNEKDKKKKDQNNINFEKLKLCAELYITFAVTAEWFDLKYLDDFFNSLKSLINYEFKDFESNLSSLNKLSFYSMLFFGKLNFNRHGTLSLQN